jgi:hypothetical protein
MDTNDSSDDDKLLTSFKNSRAESQNLEELLFSDDENEIEIVSNHDEDSAHEYEFPQIPKFDDEFDNCENDISPPVRNLDRKADSGDLLHVNNAEVKVTQHSPYQNELCKPVFSAGKTSIGFSQAKLYGLVDEKGNIKLEKKSTGISPERMKQKVETMSKPRPKTALSPNEYEIDNIKRTEAKQAAMKAMMNPRCGYDFVERLKDRGNFLDRVNIDKRKNKSQIEKEKQDYDLRLDKLKCPKCNRFQSYDEYVDKKRNCSLCNVRYVKHSVCHISSFEKRLEEKAKIREEKLTALDAEIYKDMPGVARRNVQTKSSRSMTKANGKLTVQKSERNVNNDYGEKKVPRPSTTRTVYATTKAPEETTPNSTDKTSAVNIKFLNTTAEIIVVPSNGTIEE